MLIALCIALSALLSGCTVSQTSAPVLRRQCASDLPSVGLVGFTSETVDVNPYFGGTAHSFSGTAYGRGGAVNYYGTGSSSFSGVSFSRRETSAMLGETANALADLGVPLPQNPDYIVSGTYHGPRTDWTLWYKDAAELRTASVSSLDASRIWPPPDRPRRMALFAAVRALPRGQRVV